MKSLTADLIMTHIEANLDFAQYGNIKGTSINQYYTKILEKGHFRGGQHNGLE